MKIDFRVMTPDEAWQNICDYHYMYHTYLKRFNPEYTQFIPQWSFLDEMFGIAQPLPPQQIEYYRDKFLRNYDAKQLHAHDETMKKEALPALELVAETLAPFAKKWGIKIPDKLSILLTYGFGGSYDEERNEIVMRITRMPSVRIPKTLQHELVHIIIEKDIIQKYNVPQSLYLNSFANQYINRSVIENDLPGAVRKMMMDFTQMNQKMVPVKGRD